MNEINRADYSGNSSKRFAVAPPSFGYPRCCCGKCTYKLILPHEKKSASAIHGPKTLGQHHVNARICIAGQPFWNNQ